MTFIDTHVHFRDDNWAYKCTIKKGYRLAKSQGIDVFCDMPNTDPEITSIKRVEERLKLARSLGCLDGYYLYIGATKNPGQIREAVKAVKEIPKVVGIKMFAGSSTGNLAMTDLNDQLLVYRKLAELDYDGILAVHCEKESLINEKLWKPEKPYTWNLVRPPLSEVASIEDQISLALKTGFKGTLYILHITTPASVEKITGAKSKMKIICGATPHHLSKSINDMQGLDSITYKVNPPIRSEEDRSGLMKFMETEKIDLIETDFAPHALKEKIRPPYASGTTWSLENYRSFIESLQNSGISESKIHKWTYGCAKKYLQKIVE